MRHGTIAAAALAVLATIPAAGAATLSASYEIDAAIWDAGTYSTGAGHALALPDLELAPGVAASGDLADLAGAVVADYGSVVGDAADDGDLAESRVGSDVFLTIFNTGDVAIEVTFLASWDYIVDSFGAGADALASLWLFAGAEDLLDEAFSADASGSIEFSRIILPSDFLLIGLLADLEGAADGQSGYSSYLISAFTELGVVSVAPVAPVPLPATLPLLLAGLGGLALRRR